MKKEWKKYIIITAMSVVLYLSFAFVTNKINAFEWENTARGLFATLWWAFVITTIGLSVEFEGKK